jgi:hypothetical protein
MSNINKHQDFSGYNKIYIVQPMYYIDINCEPAKSMKINGIDIAEHVRARFSCSIEPNKIMRIILYFSNENPPSLLATRAYSVENCSDGSLTSIFSFEKHPLSLCLFEFSLKQRIESVNSLVNYGYSLIIGRTDSEWNSSGYVHKYDFKYRTKRPSRALMVNVLKGLQQGTLKTGGPEVDYATKRGLMTLVKPTEDEEARQKRIKEHHIKIDNQIKENRKKWKIDEKIAREAAARAPRNIPFSEQRIDQDDPFSSSLNMM